MRSLGLFGVCAAFPFGTLAAAVPDPDASPVALDRAAPDFDFGISTAGAVGGAGSSLDLGIPDSAPWMDPALQFKAEERQKQEALRPKHPLETRFWKRLERDMVSLATWRMGLLDVLRHARGLPQVFPPRPVPTGDLFVEYADEARDAWLRAADFFVGLDSIVARYNDFTVLEGRDERRAAFAVLFAAGFAQVRFAKEWAPYARRDENLKRIFNEAAPQLGLPAGSWDRIERGRLSPEGLRSASYAHSYYRSIGGSGALSKPLGRRRRRWARSRREDIAATPKSARERRSPARSRKAVEAGVLREVFALSSDTVPFDEAVAAADPEVHPLMPPAPDGPVVTISSQVIYGIRTLRHWLLIDIPEGVRPPVLIDKSRIEQARKTLLPGDLLLARRENHLSAMGDGGYWQNAGLYVGDEAARSRLFGGDSVNELLRTRFPEAYQAHAEGGGDVLESAPDGVGFKPFERFASSDRLAVLRTRMAARDLETAVERGFAAATLDFDPWEDPASKERAGSAELIALAFGGHAERFLPDRESLGRRTYAVNTLARRFDDLYGTPDEALELVLFIEGDERRRTARSGTIEEFRSTWRRPKWSLAQEKTDEK
jgi:hypothetical protein